MGNQTQVTKLTIVAKDDPGHQVEAQYNPKELAANKKVPWTRVKSDKSDSPAQEFSNAEPETLQFELLFDTFEKKTDVYATHVAGLKAMCQIPRGKSGADKHPPRVMVIWGRKDFLQFEGVITSLATKYTMFLPDGTPVRATVTISITASKKATAKVPKKKKKKKTTT